MTAVTAAAEAGNWGDVKRLVALGHSVSSPNSWGVTPLHWACHVGRVDVIGVLHLPTNQQSPTTGWQKS